ncbi:family 16 glycosylhydrolase [Roseivirga sp. BDSF3-8]|uniref:glycoside hydrolase family 16 protein n=1 Tax=Roseivirga sp. BDSF3-8 TaxID=3241598 RepID=UPI0035324D11
MMRWLVILAPLSLCLFSCNTSDSKQEAATQAGAEGAERTEAQLIWQDEFEGNGVDTTKWTVVEGNGCPELCGFGNNERQTYTSSPGNLSVEDGKLVITARKDSTYTSAKLVTEGKGDWQYGYIEVRAKLPEGRGTWPAIWMLPTLEGRGMKWPDDGEIDIMEHVGYNQGWVYSTIHTDKYNHLEGTQKSDSIRIEDASEAFHTYAIDWDDKQITWLLDGEDYLTLEKGNDDKSGWPFDAPFHLILNTAVGGDWGGREGIDDRVWPQPFEIDYVRVYNKKPGA